MFIIQIMCSALKYVTLLKTPPMTNGNKTYLKVTVADRCSPSCFSESVLLGHVFHSKFQNPTKSVCCVTGDDKNQGWKSTPEIPVSDGQHFAWWYHFGHQLVKHHFGHQVVKWHQFRQMTLFTYSTIDCTLPCLVSYSFLSESQKIWNGS